MIEVLQVSGGPATGMRQNLASDKLSRAVSPEPLRNQARPRNIGSHDALPVDAGRHSQSSRIEVAMATKQQGRIVETPTEARQAEPGPSVFALLVVSLGLAVLVLGIVWFVFFRT
jgi:hypothetical protein